MGRPRISQKEANYLVSVLKSQMEILERERAREQELEKELWLLKAKLKDWYCSTYEKLAQIETYVQVEAELKRLQRHRFKRFQCLAIHTKLLEKYQAIADGNSRRGDFKHFNCSLNRQLSCNTEPERIIEVLT